MSEIWWQSSIFGTVTVTKKIISELPPPANKPTHNELENTHNNNSNSNSNRNNNSNSNSKSNNNTKNG